jgi:release factor glutamine methyltransferase
VRIRQIFLSEKDLPRIDLIGIVSHVLSLPPERILMESERVLDKSEEGKIGQSIDERRKGKPLAYITHMREFLSEPFYVDERVLIPRPETELLVEEALKIMRSKGRLQVLDMGTGSGVIGILLAKNGAASVLCLDISPGALAVARKNARAFGLQTGIEFMASNLFSAVKKGRPFDLICANLPYVALHEWKGLMAEVREFEPKHALVGGDAGTELYERYLEEIGDYLSEDGALLCEIGGEGQAIPLVALLKKAGFEVTVLHDLAGRQRVIKAFGRAPVKA